MANISGTYGKLGISYTVEFLSPGTKTVVKSVAASADETLIFNGIQDTILAGTYDLKFRNLGVSTTKMVTYATRWNGDGFVHMLRKRVVKSKRTTTYKNVVISESGGISFVPNFVF
jgi:hypothetical protein